MQIAWKLLKFIPPEALAVVKRWTSPKFRLWIRERFGANHRSIKDRIIAAPDGRRFHIGPDRIYWPLHIGLEYEPEASSVVRGLVQEGDVVADTGANYGWYTTLTAQLVGDSGRVVAFEPVPETHERLLENLELNELEDRVSAERFAVGDSPREISIHLFDGQSSGRASLAPVLDVGSRCVKTQVVRLEDHLNSHGIGHLDFLKCDVEGAELFVLQGAEKLLASDNAPIILIELNEETTNAFGYRPEDIWDYLEQMGYDHFYSINDQGGVDLLPEGCRDIAINLLITCKGSKVDQRMTEAEARRLSPAA